MREPKGLDPSPQCCAPQRETSSRPPWLSVEWWFVTGMLLELAALSVLADPNDQWFSDLTMWRLGTFFFFEIWYLLISALALFQ